MLKRPQFDKTQPHPQLAGLQALWAHPDKLLNAVLWANTLEWETKNSAIGLASEYLYFMEGGGYTHPKDAWVEWCEENDLLDVSNNPYKKYKPC